MTYDGEVRQITREELEGEATVLQSLSSKLLGVLPSTPSTKMTERDEHEVQPDRDPVFRDRMRRRPERGRRVIILNPSSRSVYGIYTLCASA